MPRLFFAFALLLSLQPLSVSAYSVSPLVIDLNVEQRELMTRDITIKNDGTAMVRIYPTVNEIDVDENGAIKAFQQASTIDRTEGVTSWLEITRGRIELQPGETRTVPLTIRINPQAKAGEYHAFIGFPSASNKQQADQKVMNGNAPGVVVRIGLDQERTEFLKLDGFSIKRFVTTLTEQVLHYTVSNPGESELTPTGEIIFYDTRGIEVAAAAINPEQVNIEPGGAYDFADVLPEGLKTGKYKAYMTLEYGVEQRSALTDTVFFYVMPLSTMLFIFGVVLVFALILTVVLYRRMSTPLVQHDGVHDVSLFYREGVSAAKDHDIDLKKKSE